MNKTIQEVLDQLRATGKCQIKGFGTFYTEVKKGREGVSAFNGKAWKTEDLVVLKFRAANSLDTSTYPVATK